MEWLERLDGSIENIRAALDWSVEHDPAAGVGMAGELGWYSYLRGHRAEWRARISRLLDAGGRDAPPLDLGKALFAYAMADPSPLRAADDLDAAREQFEIAGAEWSSAVSGATAVIYRSFGGDMTAAMKELDRAWDVMVELDDDWGKGLIEFFKANGAIGANDFGAVTDHAARAQQWFERTGDSWGIGYMVYFRGLTERARGHYAAAQATLNEALGRARVLGLQAEIPVMLGELANIATLEGNYAVADAALNEAATVGEATPFLGSQAMIYNARGLWWRHQGRPRQALELHRQASAAYAAADQHNGVAYSEGSAGRSAEAIGDLIAARRHQLRSLEAALAMADLPGVAFATEGMAGVAMAAGSARHGARLLGAASALRELVGLPLPQGEDFDVRRWALQGGEDLGSEAYAAAFREGTELDVDQTVAAAREEIAGT
jgi:tetratricopeptide (TPR) repeat protein